MTRLLIQTQNDWWYIIESLPLSTKKLKLFNLSIPPGDKNHFHRYKWVFVTGMWDDHNDLIENGVDIKNVKQGNTPLVRRGKRNVITDRIKKVYDLFN